uniref:Uncharacterized protein n=1 Tax=Anopheles coluzzii TaxID=1518534 RepID=A0A8W7Q348_ANOCL
MKKKWHTLTMAPQRAVGSSNEMVLLSLPNLLNVSQLGTNGASPSCKMIKMRGPNPLSWNAKPLMEQSGSPRTISYRWLAVAEVCHSGTRSAAPGLRVRLQY